MFIRELIFAMNEWNDELVFIYIFGSVSSLINSRLIAKIKILKRVLKILLIVLLSSMGIFPPPFLVHYLISSVQPWMDIKIIWRAFKNSNYLATRYPVKY